ncbi:MAG: glycosyltransferase, partial [Campylobacterales bacterium]|nr:glycosyltransferase [Campylobacterales bacterium]
MKIALMITGMGMGGAERQVCDLADRFTALGHEVLIIYLTGKAVIRPDHPDIRLIGMEMSKTPLSFIKTYIRLRRILRDFTPDVLHTHMVHANLVARLLRLSMHIPRLICTAHSTNEGGRLRML